MSNYKIHNNYRVRLVQNNKVITERIVYNEASGNVYINAIRKQKISQANISLIGTYTVSNETQTQEIKLEKTINIVFNRINEMARFDSSITFSGQGVFSNFNDVPEDANISWSLALGNGVKDSSNKVYYWSEARLGSFNVDYSKGLKILVEVLLGFSVSKPSAAGVYKDEYNAILNNNNQSFPTPLPSTFSLSPLINFPTELIKKIPVLIDLPSEIKQKTEEPDSAVVQLNNVNSNDSYLYVDVNGYAPKVSRSAYFNVGCTPTLVYNNVWANHISLGMENMSVPIVKLNYNNVLELINDPIVNEEGYAYFYASIPDGAELRKICRNKEEEISLTHWAQPPMRIEVNDIYNSIPQEAYNLTNNNELYYSNFILSNNAYWEPAGGSPVAAEYVLLSGTPTNYRIGYNISFIIQGYDEANDEWKNCAILNPDASGSITTPFKTYYLVKENYSQYRVHFINIPTLVDTKYYVNEIEKERISNKAYDKNTVLIGSNEIYNDNSLIRTDGNDFGHCGLKLSLSELIDIRNSLSSQTTTAYYYYYAVVSYSGGLYKNADFGLGLTYSMTATG